MRRSRRLWIRKMCRDTVQEGATFKRRSNASNKLELSYGGKTITASPFQHSIILIINLRRGIIQLLLGQYA